VRKGRVRYAKIKNTRALSAFEPYHQPSRQPVDTSVQHSRRGQVKRRNKVTLDLASTDLLKYIYSN